MGHRRGEEFREKNAETGNTEPGTGEGLRQQGWGERVEERAQGGSHEARKEVAAELGDEGGPPSAPSRALVIPRGLTSPGGEAAPMR